MPVKFYQPENQVPLEMHKVRVVQKLSLLPVEERLKKIQEAGNNTFLLQNKDIYLDMITDSGVNGMSDRQVAAMSIADGVRGMERGTVSEQREPDGTERYAQLELLRLAKKFRQDFGDSL